jgi:hypothetical protein
MNKQNAPYTPAAETPGEALDNLAQLLKVRNAGWDRTAVRDIIKVVYGSTENFARQHEAILRQMVKDKLDHKTRLNRAAGQVA